MTPCHHPQVPRPPFTRPSLYRRTHTPLKCPPLRSTIYPVAVPRPRIEGDETFDGREPRGGGFITPRSVVYDFFFFVIAVVVRRLQIPICGTPFPFAQGGPGRLLEGDGKGCARNVIGCNKVKHIYIISGRESSSFKHHITSHQIDRGRKKIYWEDA